ncbi:MAG: hypothetical protein IPL46_01155 [Saprospiraceae bacterium]|nr:hypothetical protein [Saprospiraceae bacterium]
MIHLLMANGCAEPQSGYQEVPDYSTDTSAIPNDTLACTNLNLAYVNGGYLLDNEPYSGVVYKVLKGYDIGTYSSVLNGQLHGTYTSFFASGRPYEIRKYRNGLSVGKHIGYWENSGKLKFEYNYCNQKKEGIQKNWYSDGSLASTYSYHDDKLDGLQQAWRENGSLYRNFVVKDGIRYGLQKTKTCYELNDGKVVLQANKTEIE